jgi:glycosyltransferase involved in cell wall biosynthesis
MSKTIVFTGTGQLPIPSDKGAIEEIIWKTSLGLSRRGYTVYIFNPVSNDLFTKYVKTLSLHRLPWNTDETIIHFHDIGLCTFYSFTSQRFHVKNTVLTLHYPPWVTKNKKRFILMLSVLKYLANRGVILVAPSTAVAHWIRKTLNAEAYLIPNGVDTVIFNPSKRDREMREKILGDKEILITYTARIHPTKNQLDLIKATSMLINSYGIRNFKVAFIGPFSGMFDEKAKKRINPYYILLRNYIEKNDLKDHVVFLGELPSKEVVANILASSDIYAHTSLVEVAVPLAVMEAMSSGLPIVAYSLVYYHDILRNSVNALLAKRGDVEDLALILASLIEDKELRKVLGRRARKFVEQYLSWEKITEKYIELYSRI